MYNIDYACVTSDEELDTALNSFFSKAKRPALLEIITPPEVNDQVLLDYFKAIK